MTHGSVLAVEPEFFRPRVVRPVRGTDAAPGLPDLDSSAGRKEMERLESLRRRLWAAARKALDDPDDSEDVCQEALLRTLVALEEGRCSRDEFAPYAFGTLRNVVHEFRRGRQRDTRLQGVEAEDPTPDPSRDLVHKEFSTRVRAALDELPPKQRQVAILALVGDVSCSEIARTHGIAAATVRQRKRRARSRLIEELEGIQAV